MTPEPLVPDSKRTCSATGVIIGIAAAPPPAPAASSNLPGQPVSPPTGGTARTLTIDASVSLESSDWPGHLIRHAGFNGFISRIDVTSDAVARSDASFIVRRGRGSADCFSFESTNYPGHFLQHENFRLRLIRAQDNTISRNGSTFCARAAQNGSTNAADISLESQDWPGFFLRHRNFEIWMDRADGSAVFRAGSTFRVGNAPAGQASSPPPVVTPPPAQPPVVTPPPAQPPVVTPPPPPPPPPPTTPDTPGAGATQIGTDALALAAGADGTIATVNRANQFWVNVANRGWERLPGSFTDLAVIGENRYYAIGTDRNVYRWSQGRWVRVGRDSVSIAASADGGVAVVNSNNGSVWIKRADDDGESWSQIPGAVAKRVAMINRSSIFMIGTDDGVWRSDTRQTVRVGRNARELTASSDGTVTVVSLDGSIWRKASNDNRENWTRLSGLATEIATPNANTLIFSNPNGGIFRR